MGGHEVTEDPNDDGTIPAEPTVRSITPAPEDFATPPTLPTYIWPTFWMAVSIALILGLSWS